MMKAAKSISLNFDPSMPFTRAVSYLPTEKGKSSPIYSRATSNYLDAEQIMNNGMNYFI